MDGKQEKKVKEEIEFRGEDGGGSGSTADVPSEFTRVAREARARLKDAAVMMANEAGHPCHRRFVPPLAQLEMAIRTWAMDM